MSTAQSGLIGFALRPLGGVIAFGTGAALVFAMGSSITQMIVSPLCDTLALLGQDSCQLVYAHPSDAFAAVLRQSVLAGMLLATPCLVFQLARRITPTLYRVNPQGAVPFAMAGGVLAVLGAAFAVFYEAPIAFAPVLISLGEMAGEAAPLGFVGDYARAALVMAGSYAAVLQLPVLGIMMIKSLRTKRALQIEGTA